MYIIFQVSSFPSSLNIFELIPVSDKILPQVFLSFLNPLRLVLILKYSTTLIDLY